MTVHYILKLLGFGCSKDKKAPFVEAADCLGVRLDFSDGVGKEVRVANRPEKAKEVADAIRAVLKLHVLRLREAPSLFGRIQFTEGQLMGRQSRLALADLRALVEHSGDVQLTPSMNAALCQLLARLERGLPRSFTVCPPPGITLVFTDGACKQGPDGLVATVGGVLYHWDAGAWHTRYFGCKLPDAMVQEWAATSKLHLIGPTELHAVVLARKLWSRFLNDRRCVFLIDHPGVLAACVCQREFSRCAMAQPAHSL